MKVFISIVVIMSLLVGYMFGVIHGYSLKQEDEIEKATTVTSQTHTVTNSEAEIRRICRDEIDKTFRSSPCNVGGLYINPLNHGITAD